MAGMEMHSSDFSHFFCGFFVESICVCCGQVVAREQTKEALEQHELSHGCTKNLD